MVFKFFKKFYGIVLIFLGGVVLASIFWLTFYSSEINRLNSFNTLQKTPSSSLNMLNAVSSSMPLPTAYGIRNSGVTGQSSFETNLTNDFPISSGSGEPPKRGMATELPPKANPFGMLIESEERNDWTDIEEPPQAINPNDFP